VRQFIAGYSPFYGVQFIRSLIEGRPACLAYRRQAHASLTSLCLSTSTGTLRACHPPDLVAVESDPLADVNLAVNNVRWVKKAGAVVVDKTKLQPR
jgi:hypothetical protein